MVRVLPLNPQLTFSGAGRRRVFRAHGYKKAGRLPFLEPSRLPPGPEVFALLLQKKPSREVPSRLRVRQTGMHGSQSDPTWGSPCVDCGCEPAAILTRLGCAFACAPCRHLPFVAFNPKDATPWGGRGETCLARCSARRRRLAARGWGYQLTPTFPRLPGIIPERFHERPPLAGSRRAAHSVLSKNRARSISDYSFLRKGVGAKIF